MEKTIYYIDDEVVLCELFEELMTSEDVTVKAFSNPDEAVKECEVNKPDMVFIDYRLYNTTGDDVARKISSQIPKALITGDMFVKSDYNFSKIFKKPVDYGELKRFLNNQAVP